MNTSRPLPLPPTLIRLLVVILSVVAGVVSGVGVAEAEDGAPAINLESPAAVADTGAGHVRWNNPLFDDFTLECCVAPIGLVDDVVACVKSLKSFSADTEVLMADGTTKPISEIEVGDEVWALDPETGEEGARAVTAVWPHEDSLLEFTVEGGSVTTTEDHHFWNASDGQWQETQQIDEGDFLLASDGELLHAGKLDWSPVHFAAAFDLTVAGLHTYFVVAGDDDVLVHNCGKAPNPALDDPAQSSGILRDAARGKGNFGIGSSTAAHADELGQAWVGAGFRRSSSNSDILVSADGLRQYRPPSYKPNQGGYQANFEWRNVDAGKWQGNGHLDITDLAPDLGG